MGALDRLQRRLTRDYAAGLCSILGAATVCAASLFYQRQIQHMILAKRKTFDRLVVRAKREMPITSKEQLERVVDLLVPADLPRDEEQAPVPTKGFAKHRLP